MTQSKRYTNQLMPNLYTKWLFPGLFASTVLVNQPSNLVVMFGQVIGWFNLLAAILVLVRLNWSKLWIFLLIIGIVVSRILRLMSDSTSSEIFYLSALNMLFCTAGVAIILNHRNMLYKQVMVLCYLNLIVMVLQVLGVGAWTQAFTTHGAGNFAEPMKTLFVSADDLQVALVQLRPAGISYSTVIVTLLTLFGQILHYLYADKRLRWGTPVLSALLVISMGKMIFVGFIILLVGIHFLGDATRRREVRRGIIYSSIFAVLYFVLFPGQWALNTSMSTFTTSVYLRLNDIMSVVNPNNPFYNQSLYFLEDTATASWVSEGQHVSGYSILFNRGKVFNYFMIIGLLGYVYALKIVRKRYHGEANTLFLAGLMISVTPFMFPFWESQLFWFIASVGLLPLYMIIYPNAFQKRHL
jgi:hypothetical protein